MTISSTARVARPPLAALLGAGRGDVGLQHGAEIVERAWPSARVLSFS